MQGLKEIFCFFSQLHSKKASTFDNILVKYMNVGDFVRFAKQFSINLSIFKLKEIYSKCTYSQMHLSNFIAILI